MKNETDNANSELSRFKRLARALFGVDKKDVPKHEPKKRSKLPNVAKES